MMDCVLKFDGSRFLPRWRGLLVLILVWVLPGAGTCPAALLEDRMATVVLYNSTDPSSKKLAEYYAQRREIPADRVVGLPCPATEEISRSEFESTIAEPVRQLFVRKGWWSVGGGRVSGTQVRFLVLIRGMPLKIRSRGELVTARTDQPAPIGKRDEASVDSELACLGMGEVPSAGLIPNTYYQRYTRIVEAIADPGLLLVCRLDAASEITVRGMIDDAISAERDGLWGWAYVDGRGITTGGYAIGDEWLGTAVKSMRERGIPVLWEKAPATLPAGYPITDGAVYFGWYANSVNGPFADPALRFRPGAIAVHIHSFSAATLRNAAAGWCAPLLERGAAVTLGNVYEPYLTLTANLDIFEDRLMQGFNFAESAYMSMRALSWMGVVVGDPLYRPYAAWHELSNPGAKPLSSWEQYRRLIQDADGEVLAAASGLEKAAAQTGRSMFLESLAAVQADAGDQAAALKTLDQALAMKNSALVRFRLSLEKFGLLRVAGKKSEAGALLMAERARSPGPAQTQLLDALHRSLFPPTPSPSSSPAPAP